MIVCFETIFQVLAAVLLSPLLVGTVNRTKAFFAGRKGPPLLQPYYDLEKLFRKGAVYSRTTTWVFKAGPIVYFAASVSALFLFPFGNSKSPLAFQGDLVLFTYLMALGRFMMLAAALDTGSSFEGMGASREAQFSVFNELAFSLGLMSLAVPSGKFSISEIFFTQPGSWEAWSVRILTALVFLMVFLAENARIPVDDPNTHLELTMIHEAMILDHGGADLAAIFWASAMKMWMFGMLAVLALMPPQPTVILSVFSVLGAMGTLAVMVGIIESVMARFKMNRVPSFLFGASALAAVALGLTVMR